MCCGVEWGLVAGPVWVWVESGMGAISILDWVIVGVYVGLSVARFFVIPRYVRSKERAS